MKKDIWIMQVELTRNNKTFEDVVTYRCDENAVYNVDHAFNLWLEDYNKFGIPTEGKLIRQIAVATIRVGNLKMSITEDDDNK